MLPSWCNEAVTVRRAAMATVGTRQERDWANATESTVSGCILVRPRTSTDFGDPARTRAIDWLLLAPPASDIAEGDRIVHGGRVYEVDGIALERTSPSGAVSHVRAALVAWGG